MVSRGPDGRPVHARFRDLPDFLDPGDVLVVTTSGTRNAAVPVERGDGTPLELRLSTRLPAGLWTVELRHPVGETTDPTGARRPVTSYGFRAGRRRRYMRHTPPVRGSGSPRCIPHCRWTSTSTVTALPSATVT